MTSSFVEEPSSFRDPSGFLFYHDRTIFRQVNQSYKEDYDHLISSGLYKELTATNLLLEHEDVDFVPPKPELCYKIIKPKKIDFITYPYEWSFSQLKDAALITLEIQKKAMNHGMTLKDATAYNIQFNHGKPIFVDTLSFEKYKEGQIWKPYKQFCQHFLAPLALMSYQDIRFNQLFKIFIDGIPLDITSKLLPFSTKTSFSLMSHIHLHAKSQKHYEDKSIKKEAKMGKNAFIGIIDNLHSSVKKMDWSPKGTEWADYYSDTNYTDKAFEEKKKIILQFLDAIKPENVWDLGGNVGIFSRLASGRGIQTISFDIDPAAVEKNYLELKKNDEKHILPLVLDLTNPSPGIGWENTERKSLIDRGPTDTAFALALIHHLAISNNLPFDKIANFFRMICTNLVIEFVPKSDSQVQRLLSTREDIFNEYTEEQFKRVFNKYFTIRDEVNLMDSERKLFRMEKLIA